MSSRVLGAVVAALVLALVGCSSDDEPSGEPTGQEPSGPTDSTPPTDPTSETSSASPSVAPAAGPLVDTEAASYRLPDADWSLGRDGQSAHYYDDAGYSWDISSLPAPAISDSVDRLARSSLQLVREDHAGAERLADRSVAGVDGYVLEAGAGNGPDGDGLYYEYGTVHGDYRFSIYFEFPEDSPKAREWVESVLASIAWR